MKPTQYCRACEASEPCVRHDPKAAELDGIKVSPRVLKAWLEVQQRQAALRSDLAAVGDYVNRGGRGRELEFRLLAILLGATTLQQEVLKCVIDVVRDEQEAK